MNKVLIVTESKTKKMPFFESVDQSGIKTVIAATSELSQALTNETPACVLFLTGSDLTVVKDVITTIKNHDDSLALIVVGETKNVDDAVSIMKMGVFDFFNPPLHEEELKHSIQNAIRLYDLTKQIFFLENQMGWTGKFENIIGHASSMQDIFRMITTVGKSDATVLISGESGTGKELVARAVHQLSPRRKGEFIDINCGAIPHELLENELFGHEKGAYTGADRRYIGCCERASKGTLFLDEICEMAPSLQVKILRLLQEKTLTRVGGTEQIKVDVRFVAATNRNILDEVKKGNFREDLYYRLNVVPIHVPSLRDRKEDIPLLAKFFLDRFSEKNEKIFVEIAPEALEMMINYNWPGNVRELENTIERAVVLNNDSRLKAKHLPDHLQQVKRKIGIDAIQSMGNGEVASIVPLELVEKFAIESALKRCEGNVGEAARKLKIGQATMYRKIRQFGLKEKS